MSFTVAANFLSATLFSESTHGPISQVHKKYQSPDFVKLYFRVWAPNFMGRNVKILKNILGWVKIAEYLGGGVAKL